MLVCVGFYSLLTARWEKRKMSPSERWSVWEERWKGMERVQKFRVSEMGKAECFCPLNQDLKMRMKRTLRNESPLGNLSYRKGWECVPKIKLRFFFFSAQGYLTRWPPGTCHCSERGNCGRWGAKSKDMDQRENFCVWGSPDVVIYTRNFLEADRWDGRSVSMRHALANYTAACL